MKKRGTTDTAIKLVQSFPTYVKVLIAVAATITTLYGGVKFVVDSEYARFEKEQKKIGREEFKSYKDATKQTLDDYERRLRELERKR